jgi:short-subunit dehydrogenase
MMNFNLRGGVAVVTGAASGIGAALARGLAAKSCDLALADRDAAGLATSAAAARERGVKVSEHVLDVSDAKAIATLPDQVLAQHGRINVLINNAGVALGGTFAQTDLADFEWLMNINFYGVVRMTHAFLPFLQREQAAQIVNISSIFGIIAPPGQTAYCASKFGVRGFSESLRHELLESSIGVTVVHPGGVATNIAENARNPKGLNSDEVEQRRARARQMLTLSPDIAAATIIDGIERRADRVLIGSDARRAALIQRLFPMRYWRIIRRSAPAGPAPQQAKSHG